MPQAKLKQFNFFWKFVLIWAIIIVLSIAVVSLITCYKLQKQTTLPIAEQKLIVEVNTENWLTYTNEEYGFEFQVPADIEVISENNAIFLKRDGLSIYNIVTNREHKGYPECFKEINKTKINQIEWSINDFVCGDPALYKSMGGVDYVTVNNQEDVFFNISLSRYQERKTELHQILSTFKFTD